MAAGHSLKKKFEEKILEKIISRCAIKQNINCEFKTGFITLL